MKDFSKVFAIVLVAVFFAVAGCSNATESYNNSNQNSEKQQPQNKKYKVNVSEGIQNGSVNINYSSAEPGVTMGVTVTPNSGYDLNTFLIVDDNNSSIHYVKASENGKYYIYFTMPSKNVTLFASFKQLPPNSYAIMVSSQNRNGSVTANKTGAVAGEKITLFIRPNSGYELGSLTVTDANGNAVGLSNLSDNEKTFIMPEKAVVVTATFKAINYSVNLPSSFENGSVTVDKTTAAVGNYVWLTLKPNDGYEVDSLTVLADDNSSVYYYIVPDTNNRSIRVTMPAQNIRINVTFKKLYLIILPQNVSGGYVNANKAKAIEGESVTLTVSPNAGYRMSLLTILTDNGLEVSVADNEFLMPNCNVTVSVSFSELPLYEFHESVSDAGNVTINGRVYKLVFFGDWPQTIKSNDIDVDETKAVSMGENTYYLGSDNNYYYKCVENPRLEYNETSNGSKKYYTYSDGTRVSEKSKNSYKYFRVEPILWRILSSDYNGKKLLLAEKILCADEQFNTGYEKVVETYRYSSSHIRWWLNNYFLNTAFTTLAQNSIFVTNIETSLVECVERMQNGYRFYEMSCVSKYKDQNTKDKVFLLDYNDIINEEYGFSSLGEKDDVKIRKVTDYALASFCSSNRLSSVGIWFLRSTSEFPLRYALSVWEEDSFEGKLYLSDVRDISTGIVPALCVEE